VARGERLRLGAAALAGIEADLAASDLGGRPILDGRVAADRLVLGGETFDAVRLAAVGTPAASDVTLTAKARGFALDGRARLVPGERTRIEIASLSASRGARRLALVRPATVTLEGAEATIAGLEIAADKGRITAEGRAGARLDLKLAARNVPLSIAEILRPDLKLDGTLDGEADLSGTPAEPEGRYRLSLARLATRETREAGLPPLGATLSGSLAKGRAEIDARVDAGRAGQVRASGSVPLDSAGPLAVAIEGSLDAAFLNSALAVSGQQVSGRVAVDADVSGTLTSPQVAGSATLTGGSFTDPLQGIRLSNIEGRLAGRGESLTIERLTATARNGGRLSLQGRVTLDPEGGFPGELTLTASRAELVSNDIVTAVADLDLALAGPLARSPRASGRVELVSFEVSIPDRLPATVRPLPGTRHVAPPPQVRARLAAEKRQASARRAGPAAVPFDATLDIALSAPNRVFVRGRGVDAELGGDLRLTGTSRAPVAVGAFDLRRGRLSILGQRLDFARGRLSFTGDLSPELDLAAETRAGDVTAQILVKGPASQPTFELTSEPSLPQDEVLSRLLFAKATGNLSAFQALQLAQAVAQLSGSGPDVFDRARRALGVDSLDITTGTRGGPAVGASRYIGDRVSVGVRAGARPEDSAATVNVDVTRRLKVQGELGADGRSSVGVGAEWEY
jgi:translocation and assembly module TamB